MFIEVSEYNIQAYKIKDFIKYFWILKFIKVFLYWIFWEACVVWSYYFWDDEQLSIIAKLYF